MRVVIQRVEKASVSIENQIHSEIDKGFLLLLGIENEDSDEDVEWICKKVLNMRLFADGDGKMNLSINEVKGSILVVSQFTLHASNKKGNRPSFIKAARPEIAMPIYEMVLNKLSMGISRKIRSIWSRHASFFG